MSLGMLTKSVAALGLALQLWAALPSNPGLHPEVKEAFFTFMFTPILALAFGWWGVSKFRRRKPDTGGAR